MATALQKPSPYGKRVQNGIRLACLLIEVGTPIVRNIFDSLVQRKSADLRSLLDKKDVKAEMRQYLHGSKRHKKKKLLNEEQFRQLYHYHHESDDFDLTLLILLIQILCKEPPPPSSTGWNELPDGRDHSRSADLVRIRKTRNELYAHIKKIGYDEQTFENEWKTLTEILIRLGAEQHEIQKWREHTLCGDECTLYQNKMAMLIINDTNATIELMSTIQNNISKQLDISSDTKNTIEILKRDCETVKTEILHLRSENQESFMNKLNEMMDNLYQEINVKDVLQEWGDVLVKRVAVEISSALEQRGELYTEQKEPKMILHYNEQASKIEALLSANKSAFKILAINSPNHQMVSKVDMKEFAKHLGFVPWDFVIDLDFNSRADGIHDTTAEVLRKHKNFQVITYNETKDITDVDQQDTILGKKAIWILANGCSETDCPPSLDKFGKAKRKIMNLLSNVLAQSLKPRRLLVTLLVQSEEAVCAMREVVQDIKDVTEERDSVVADDFSAVVEIHLGGTSIDQIATGLTDMQNTKPLHSSHRNFACMLGRLFSVPQTQVKYYFPGTPGEAYLTDADVARSAASLELYHRDIGKMDFENMSQNEISKKVSDIRIQFLRGCPITPEAIFLNSTVQVYVKRSEMGKAKSRLENKLKYSKWDERERRTYFIDHEASGGGTTVATVLLYELKDEYPCARVLKIDECLYDGLLLLFNTSRKVLLLLIDNDKISESDIRTLSKRLENSGIKAQIVVTRHLKSLQPDSEEFDPDRIRVSGSLKGVEEMAFINLFKEYGKIDGAHRIFPIGLQAFLKDHSKLNSHVQMCMDTTNDDQRLVLRLICMIWKYGQCRLSVKMIQAILEVGPNEMHDNAEGYLGYVSDFVLFSERGEAKLASTCVIQPILESAFGIDEISWINGFIGDITLLIERMKEDSEDISDLIQHVFIKREREARGSSIHWSPFIQSMKEKRYSKKEIALHLERIIDNLVGASVHPHMQALLARFYMYELNDPSSSMDAIHAALHIERDQTVASCKLDDVHLLTTYGTLYRERVYREKVSKDITTASSYFEEAITALCMAKHTAGDPRLHTRSRHNAVPFIQEARAREHMLRLYLNEKCNGNRQKFMEFLGKPDTGEFLAKCENKAHEALDTVDFLHMQDRLHEDSSRYVEAMQRVRFDLLLLHADRKEDTREMIEAFPVCVPCDVGSLIRRPRNATTRTEWEELPQEDILFIIEEIFKRLALQTVLRNNYEDIITAMIHIKNCRGQVDHDKYNLDLATECATQWVKRYKDDHHAHFMLGVLRFIQVIGGKENEGEKDDEATKAFKSLQQCRDICLDLKSTSSFRRFRFHIGPNAGLAKLIPSEYYRDGNELHEFRGRQVAKHYVTIRGFPGTIKVSISLKDVLSLHEQQPLVKFNLAFSHDGLKAINPKYIEEN